jgi:hypothetical protein
VQAAEPPPPSQEPFIVASPQPAWIINREFERHVQCSANRRAGPLSRRIVIDDFNDG